jgi:Fe-S-cluster-containing hydrogenase component 2
MSFNSEIKKVVKCDLCEGDPLCVKFCAYDTLTYVEADEINEDKLSDAAEIILKTCKFNP